MKTILVLTDFSISADYTAHYALQLAQHIKADLLLCNIYYRPGNEAAKRKTSLDSGFLYETAQTCSKNDLDELTSRLNLKLDKESDKTLFRPEIRLCSKSGEMANAFSEITGSENIIMAILSMHEGNLLETVLFGDHVRSVLKIASFPVLVIPYQVSYKDYKIIAFASDLSHNDVNVIESISVLAKHTDSDILIANVDSEYASDQEENHVIRKFFNRIPFITLGPNVHYRSIKSRHITRSLKFLADRIEIDMLVLVQRRHTAFQRLFKGSVIPKMAHHPSKPLLIFPYARGHERLSFF